MIILLLLLDLHSYKFLRHATVQLITESFIGTPVAAGGPGFQAEVTQ